MKKKMSGIAILSIALAIITAGSTGIEYKFRNDWRDSAIQIVEAHLKSHPDCELNGAAETLKDMQIFFTAKFHPKTLACSFPKVGGVPTMAVNANYEWTEAEAIITLIHESLHLTRRNDQWICGPDHARGSSPACRMFGRSQFTSEQITRDLQEHLSIPY